VLRCDGLMCDNCTRRSDSSKACTVQRTMWIPALLALMQKALSDEASPTIGLRKFAKFWCRSKDAPQPVWFRKPLLLHALHHGVLCLTFSRIVITGDDDVAVLGLGEQLSIRWELRVYIDGRGRSTAQKSLALESIRLHPSLWGPVSGRSESELDDVGDLDDDLMPDE
jgi:hypothetical protein